MNKSVWLLLLVFVLCVSGCGGGNDTSSTPKSITIKGSDTMVILGQRWAEEYMKENPGIVSGNLLPDYPYKLPLSRDSHPNIVNRETIH